MNIFEKIPSKLELIDDFVTRLFEKLKVLRISDDDIFALRLAVEEAITNAIRHGNKLNPELSVVITVQKEKDDLIITVKDKGEGFDYSKLGDPTEKENITKLSGRGVYLIKKIMDRVEFFENGSGIRMVKSLK